MSTPIPAPDWVTERFGVRLDGDPRLSDLVRLAVRRNPRRAHLLVSGVLGKHVPVDPRLVHSCGLELGALVAAALAAEAPGAGRVAPARRPLADARSDIPSALVLGFAETATGLGHCVAQALGAPYLHSTRRRVAGVAEPVCFEEEHSHATGHRLLPEDPALLRFGDVLILVDDELSTGRTARNTIRALREVAGHCRYLIAALVDLRGPDDRAALARFAAELDVTIDVVALAAGTVSCPPGFAARASATTVTASAASPSAPVGPRGQVFWYRHSWPDGVRESGRHGYSTLDIARARSAAGTVAAAVVPRCGRRVLVLGTEELMYAPLLIALAVAERVPEVRVSSTTRSPVIVVNHPDYPVRDALTFPSGDVSADEPGRRYAYNLGYGFDDIVLVVDGDSDTPQLTETGDSVVAALATRAARVHVVVLPCYRPLPAPLRGPAFGSYREREVSWLLTDLSGVPLEAPPEEREEAIQSGGAHYAESLPVEYQPDGEYLALFEQALQLSAVQVARAVGVVTEIVLAERGPQVVLASLARAGTPIGILMRRWAELMHGLDLPHYAVSIVRGQGIDTVALRYLAAHHRPADVVFVDGWTGKGAIARELAMAIRDANTLLGTEFSDALTVLADPGSCVETFGTRADFLIPSACLNSTVSGLVSRTVLNASVLGPGQFHGAKFYRELASADVSARFVDTVAARFPDAAAEVARQWPVLQASDRRPTWSGWRHIEAIAERFDISDVTLVKPGVGETTRVLLRRVPWAVLVDPAAGAELDHVRLLARRRKVVVHEVDGLGYRCVGLIHPRYTRGASGQHGRAVS